MKSNLFVTVISLVSLTAGADVASQRTEYRSPLGVTESCVAIAHVPGGKYSDGDEKTEQKLCGIDLYAPNVALCPKTWSTSPGTMVYDTEGISTAQYEATKCAGKKGHKKIAKFKSTMSTPMTSSTYSTSSLLYYHLSRYFNTQLGVPVSVYRTIDAQEHLQRVSSKAVGIGKMNQAAWGVMRTVEANPVAYTPTDDLFTADRKQIYGIFIDEKGAPSGAELEGTEAGGYIQQNTEFQQTPAMLAIDSAKPLAQAVDEGATLAARDPIVAKAMNGKPSPQQMVYWMRDMVEMTLLDYIFGQQDRIMNIDMAWEWVYVNQGDVQHAKVDKEFKDTPRTRMAKIPVPAELAQMHPQLIERAVINDNDAGAKPQYSNFTKKTQMLEKMHHYSAELYRKLVNLNKDFASKGPVYQYLTSSFGLNAKQVATIVDNTQTATATLQASCRAGQLQFDIKPKEFFMGNATAERVDCVNP